MADDPSRAWKSFAACAIPVIPVLIRQMTSVTEQTEAAVLTLMTRLRTIAQRAARQTDDAIELMNRAAETRTGADREAELRVSADRAKQRAGELSNDIGQIIMALQFQDITRQQLERVETVLLRMGNHLQLLVDGKPDEDLDESLSLLKTLANSHTIEADRGTHAAANGCALDRPSAAESPADSDDSVTLFSS